VRSAKDNIEDGHFAPKVRLLSLLSLYEDELPSNKRSSECKERQYDTDTKMPPLECESITDFNVGVTLGTGSFGRVRVSCDTL